MAATPQCATLSDDTEHARIGQVATGTNAGKTYYRNDPASGAMEEAFLAGPGATYRDFIIADGHMVAERVGPANWGAMQWGRFDWGAPGNSIIQNAEMASVGAADVIAAGAIGGAVGSIVSQGVGLATGLQSKFNWGGVAEAAIGGAIAAGIGPGGVFGADGAFTTGNAALNAGLDAATGDALSQGIDVAAGLQSKYDWGDVAAAGVAAGVGRYVGGQLQGAGGSGVAVSNTVDNAIVAGMAGDIAGAAARSLIDGTDFGDNILSGLPNVIGQTIGNAIAGGIDGDSSAEQAQATPQAGANGSDPLDAAIQQYQQMYNAGDLIDGSPAMQINSDGTVTPLLNADGTQAIINEACFVAGTLIHTRDGLKPIEQVSAGDWVAARHQLNADGTVGWRKVLETYQHGLKTVLDLVVQHPTGEQETFTTTPNHRFFVNGQEWRAASELQAGDRFSLRDGGASRFVGTSRVDGLHTVYNFAVEEDHTYFVGERGIWVHNEYYTPGETYTGVDGQTYTTGQRSNAQGLHPVGGYSNAGQFPGFIPGNATTVVVFQDSAGNTYYEPVNDSGPLSLPMALVGPSSAPSDESAGSGDTAGIGSGQVQSADNAPSTDGEAAAEQNYSNTQYGAGWLGIAGSTAELTSGAAAIGFSAKAASNFRVPVRFYPQGWSGGSVGRWQTFGIAKYAKAGGEVLGGFSIALEVGSYALGYNKEPFWKLGLDVGVGAAALAFGPEVGLAAGAYFLVDTFYGHGADYQGGGIEGLVNDTSKLISGQNLIQDDRPMYPRVQDDVPPNPVG